MPLARTFCSLALLAGLLAASGAPIQADVSSARRALGAALFGDVRLSASGAYACASCHRPARAYSDGLPRAVGASGELGARNTPTLLHAGSLPAFTWDEPRITGLRAPIASALTRTAPVEMGAGGREAAILAALRADPLRRAQFAAAFPGEAEPVLWQHVVEALAAFVASLGGASAYDRYLAGDSTALSARQVQGLRLFRELGCASCHSGPQLTNGSYHNLGLYNVGGRGAYPPRQEGLAANTDRPADTGRFRVPSLRNVAATAPYFHDGSAANLNDVIDVYAQGGRLIERGPWAGDGRASPYKSGAITPITLRPEDRAALIAFLESLSDEKGE
jgi:cytochrome c peroxidase